jgi:hypothetical protein
MYTRTQKRFYSPRFSETAAVSVRRLAWALNKPMTETVNYIIQLLPSMVEPSKVCLPCKDTTRCKGCTFRNQLSPQEKAALLALL